MILLLCVLITIPFRLIVHPEPHTYLTMIIDVISFWWVLRILFSTFIIIFCLCRFTIDCIELFCFQNIHYRLLLFILSMVRNDSGTDYNWYVYCIIYQMFSLYTIVSYYVYFTLFLSVNDFLESIVRFTFNKPVKKTSHPFFSIHIRKRPPQKAVGSYTFHWLKIKPS